MKWRYAVYLAVLILAGCGSGGGGSSAPAVAVAVTPAKSPVLLSYTSNKVHVALPASVADGATVLFSASSPSVSLLPATAIVTGGVATTRLKSSATGKFLVTATSTVGSTVYSGSAFVTFISQPSSVRLSIALQPTVSNLGGLQFTIRNDPGISAFQNFTSYNPGFIALTNLSAGQLPPGNGTNVVAISASGVTIASATPLFGLTYSIGANGGLPAFAIDPASLQASFANGSAITPPPTFLLAWKYNTDIF